MRSSALLTLLLAVLLAGCASSHGQTDHRSTSSVRHVAPSVQHRTVTKAFHAYNSVGQLAVPVAHATSGNCWTSSIAAPVAGAYRCFAGEQILDPCFAPPSVAAPSQLACFAAPWSRAVELTLTTALPNSTPSVDGGRPWAVQLSNGARCVSSTGTVPRVAGVNLDYHCTDGGNAAIGDTSAALVGAQYAASETQSRLLTVSVTTIWRA